MILLNNLQRNEFNFNYQIKLSMNYAFMEIITITRAYSTFMSLERSDYVKPTVALDDFK